MKSTLIEKINEITAKLQRFNKERVIFVCVSLLSLEYGTYR